MSNKITEQPFCQTRVSGSTFVNADCFDVFPFIEDKSIDAIICDLPYGTTACKWDTMGSGTTNLACIKLNRKSIGIEKEKQYYDVAIRRASEYCH